MNQQQETLIQRAQALVDEVNSTHKYSMSRIYAIYNEITGKTEVPQNCSSCLVRKVNFIQSWLKS